MQCNDGELVEVTEWVVYLSAWSRKFVFGLYDFFLF